MRATVGSWSALRLRNSIFCHAFGTAIHRLIDGETANIAVKAFRPPDISMMIEGNQMGSRIASGLGEILIHRVCAQCAGKRWGESANLGDRAIIFCEPERACAGVWPGNTVWVAIRRGSWGLGKLAGYRVKFRKPDISRQVEGEIIRHGI